MADVHRSTFYTHYTDQFDLLQQVQIEVLDNIKLYIEQQNVHQTRFVTEQKLARILDYGKNNSALVAILLDENSGDYFQNAILDYVNLISLSNQDKLSDNIKNYIAFFCVSGTIGIIRQWLSNGMLESTAEIARLILTLCKNDINRVEWDSGSLQ